jgi:hypothetical protein
MRARWVNVVLGLWLVAAALLLAEPGTPPRIADLSAGVALVLVSLLAPPGTPAGLSAVVLGVWLMIAPSALAYPEPLAALVDVLTGMAIVSVGLHPRVGVRPAAGA